MDIQTINDQAKDQLPPKRATSRSFRDPESKPIEGGDKQEEIAASRHHSSMHNINKILDVDSKIQKKASEDLGEHKEGQFFEEANNKAMSVHDCNPGQNESDDKSEYTYVSVSNMSNNQGATTNSIGMMSPNERLPIQVSKMQQSKRNSDQDSPENNSQTVEPKKPEPT